MKSKAELLAEEYVNKYYPPPTWDEEERADAYEHFLAGRKSLEDELKSFPEWDEQVIEKEFLRNRDLDCNHFYSYKFGRRDQFDQCAKYMAAKDKLIEGLQKCCDMYDLRTAERNNAQLKIAEQAQEIAELESDCVTMNEHKALQIENNQFRDEITRLNNLAEMYDAKYWAEFNRNEKLKALLDEAKDILKYPDMDCGDNSCRFADRSKPMGMRTNGGCRCTDKFSNEFVKAALKARAFLSKLEGNK